MEELTLQDYLTILRRRKNYFFLTFTVLFIATIVFALSWSNYRAEATVEIEQPEITRDVTTMGTTASDTLEALADLRISKIQQKVTAPANLVEIISKFNLYPSSQKLTPMDTLAVRMLNKIHLTLIGSTVANPAATQKVSADQLSAIAFTVSFDYADPHVAQQVTNEIVTRFLDEDLKERRQQSEATSEFLAAQITALEASMAEQEKKIASFQEQHGANRPEQLVFNQQAASNAQMGIESLDSQLASNEGTQGVLRAQLASVDPYSRVIADGQVMTTPATQLKALESQYATLTAQYGPEHPDVIKTKHQIESLKEEVARGKGPETAGGPDPAQLKMQIADLQTNLKAIQQTDGPDNPDVISMRNQVKNLQAQLANAHATNQSQQDAIKKDADNPAYLQVVASLRSAEEQHKSLEAEREALSAQQQKYQDAVIENPAVEKELASLSRDYDNSQIRYRELREKKMTADMEGQMIQDRKGERLIVINPPSLPTKTHPSRIMLIIAGLMVSIMGGFASVVAVQIINQGIMGASHLTSLVGVAPLVTIPYIHTKEESRRIARRTPLIIGTTSVIIISALLVFQYSVMPLDVLWSIIAQRLGIS